MFFSPQETAYQGSDNTHTNSQCQQYSMRLFLKKLSFKNKAISESRSVVLSPEYRFDFFHITCWLHIHMTNCNRRMYANAASHSSHKTLSVVVLICCIFQKHCHQAMCSPFLRRTCTTRLKRNRRRGRQLHYNNLSAVARFYFYFCIFVIFIFGLQDYCQIFVAICRFCAFQVLLLLFKIVFFLL